MKRFISFALIIVLLSSLLISSCGELMTGDFKYFDSKLRGTWISNDSGLYSGTLTISSDTITIDGYGEDWKSMVGDDSKRPFKDIHKRVSFKGYSEDDKIFIENGDAAQNGIPYIYTEVETYQKRYKLFDFSFGDRKEILQFKADY